LPLAAWTRIVKTSDTVGMSSPVTVEPVIVPAFAFVSFESSSVSVSFPVPVSTVSSRVIESTRPSSLETLTWSSPAPVAIVVRPPIVFTSILSAPAPLETVVVPACVLSTTKWLSPKPRWRLTASRPE
jgi:hypothetical protein